MSAGQDTFFDLARDLLVDHAERLAAGERPTASVLLLNAGRCPRPECAGPLLRGGTVARCRACGHTVETTE